MLHVMHSLDPLHARSEVLLAVIEGLAGAAILEWRHCRPIEFVGTTAVAESLLDAAVVLSAANHRFAAGVLLDEEATCWAPLANSGDELPCRRISLRGGILAQMSA